MRLSDVRRLLDGDLSAGELRARNADVLADYGARMAQRGSVVPIRVTEDLDLSISAGDVLTACALFRSGELRGDELAFIADALQLSERVKFEGPDVADYIAEFTDPDVNGSFTFERADAIMKTLSRST